MSLFFLPLTCDFIIGFFIIHQHYPINALMMIEIKFGIRRPLIKLFLFLIHLMGWMY
jgi:hypothetical protein